MYRKMERFDDAEQLLDEAVKTAKVSLPQGHWYIGFFLGKYGHLLYHLKRYDEAEVALLESHEILVAAFGASNSRSMRVGRLLADLYESWGKPDEAAQWRAKLPDEVNSNEQDD